MKSLTDLQWYDQNGNPVKSYDANGDVYPAIVYFTAAVTTIVEGEPVITPTSKPSLLQIDNPVEGTTYVLKMAYTAQDGWQLSWVAES